MDGPLLLIMFALLAGFMFLSFRNNKKRQQAQQELRDQAVPGARIQLTCGLFGTVVADDGGDSVEVEIAPGVVTTWNKLAVRDVVSESGAEGVSLGKTEDDEYKVPDYTEEDAARDAAAEAAAKAGDAPEITAADSDSKDK
ncbi:MAG: preprotein translocase subunit YajC [Gordonia sp. (in: high G+C Gram-positive bacteria)]|uniref:preprotein translocase subunit YajC n=1 Tax=Gordonia sp. (in: high G+C Gram-positive bacteria) TaxID=84139 RepID=UPI0039E4554A